MPPAEEEPCDSCGGVGWIVVTVSGSSHLPDDTKVVQRCDACGLFDDDETAAKIANTIGLACNPRYPCVVHPIQQPKDVKYECRNS